MGEISEKAGLAERKANALQGELEESRALLDSADRSKKQCDMELAEARSAVNDMTTINSKAASEKRHLESAVHTVHAEIDDMLHQAKGSEEKAKKAMVDAARLADELCAEQDHAAAMEKGKRTLESQINELENRLAEANQAAAKVAGMPWPSLSLVFVRWRLSWEVSRARPLSHSKLTRRLRERSRSCASSRMRTTKIRTRCLNSPTSSRPRSRPTRSRSRRLKRLPPSTWQSSGRLSRSWRRPRTGPKCLRPSSQWSAVLL